MIAGRHRYAQRWLLSKAFPSQNCAQRATNTGLSATSPLRRCAYAQTTRGRLQRKQCRQIAAQTSHDSPIDSEADCCPSTSGRHCLACGQKLELISCYPKKAREDCPPLLFIHGAMHGAWCFAENFLPFFAERGYKAHALSLRGHGESDYVAGQTGSFAEHIDDLASVIRSLSSPPVLVAHSLGGLLAQRYLTDCLTAKDNPKVAGVAFLAAPALSATLSPSLQWFQQLQGVLHGLKIVWWMSALPAGSKDLVQELFFSKDLPQEKFLRYHSSIKMQRRLLPMNGRELTDFKVVMDRSLKQMRQQQTPILVMAAGADKMLMPCQVDALAAVFGCKVCCAPQLGHDLMLDTRWQCAAEMLDTWVQSLNTEGAPQS